MSTQLHSMQVLGLSNDANLFVRLFVRTPASQFGYYAIDAISGGTLASIPCLSGSSGTRSYHSSRGAGTGIVSPMLSFHTVSTCAL